VKRLTNEIDRRHMRMAIGLARRGLGNTWPNPSVGCVLVKDGVVVGRGWTQPGGRPHAETEALARAGAAARGATAYVTLEPCAHHGKTPPCAEALIAAGVRRVVAAEQDPDPRVDGGGFAKLRAAGIEVEQGVCAAEAAEVSAGFFTRVRTGRPLVTLKVAASLDGRIATRTGASKWISGERARAAAHGLRACHDAILVGAGTALADDPELTCRLPGLAARSPVRVVVGGRRPLPDTLKLVCGARATPTWLIAPDSLPTDRDAAYVRHGVDVVRAPAGADGAVDLGAALQRLGDTGLTRVLVEGGAKIAAGLLARGLVDRLVWFRSSSAIGGDGLAALAAFGVDVLDAAPKFVRLSSSTLGEDVMETFARAA
jgi:diaminohydroxyphosphoribosylaminopyrimidine deaminase/5-amino-6-(5-phosphoribosylamino)uracil reductase